MLYLSAFFGRTISDVSIDDNITLEFSEFSITFFTKIEFVSHSLNDFKGLKFLYIQKNGENVVFHFSENHRIVTNVIEGQSDQYLKLSNKDRETLIRLDDGKVFESI
jgi:hypothetical protein